MDKMWAPWRIEYIRTPGKSDGECILCQKAHSKNDRDELIVYRGKYSFVLLNLYPYNNGHLLITPYKHTSNFDSLNRETQIEMMDFVSKSMKIIKKIMNAEGFNFGANFGDIAGAGIDEHVHLHLVPRWKGDTNFMPVLGHTKVMVEDLKSTRDLLKKEFNKI
ncbi:MAG: HIT domain-containing protein [Candidatus Marinimicrobia bacterium]|nr:HIT domain-containing protein [Candidatus Neomarinimicrobiota bacterium]MBL7023541.1 HIT domain-containing protein [Candidatus Neomarinimicrobiota bacterium]MBL7109565.1 HIT domain-containing protein [Candidatus Neomarinimicrobiota bacterium]